MPIMLGSTPLAGNLKSKFFSGSGTFVVPADVYMLLVDGCAGGSGGGGGDPTPGGGGGGGCAGQACQQYPFAVSPGETLTLVVGAYGTGGTASNNGNAGGSSSVTGALDSLVLQSGNGGAKASGTAGGNGGGWVGGSNINGGAGGANGVAGGNASPQRSTTNNYQLAFPAAHSAFCPGAGGGGLNANGGLGLSARNDAFTSSYGSGGSSGGGGGGGGGTQFGKGGNGGSNGSAGAAATGYGAGGGGASGNSSGGNGSTGFLRLFMITSYTI